MGAEGSKRAAFQSLMLVSAGIIELFIAMRKRAVSLLAQELGSD